MDRRDGRLQGEAPRGAAHPQRPLDAGGAARDRLAVPEAPVLVGQQHQRAVVAGARGAAGVVQRHQREQAGRLGLVGHQAGQDRRQADRLLGQVVAAQGRAGGRDVALGEDQREDREDDVEPVGQPVARGHLERDAGVADLALGPDEALADRRDGQQQRARDLGDGQPGDQAQGQRHLGLAGQGRMAAGEDEPQALVGDLVVADAVGDHLGRPRLDLARPGRLGRAPGALAAQAVDGAVARGGDDPGEGGIGDPVARPALERGGVRVLQRVLGAVDVAEDAREDGQRPRAVVADDAGDRVAAVGQSNSMIGRTSTLPRSTLGMRAAASMAWSRVSHSTM